MAAVIFGKLYLMMKLKYKYSFKFSAAYTLLALYCKFIAHKVYMMVINYK